MESRNTPSQFLPLKREKSAGLMGQLARLWTCLDCFEPVKTNKIPLDQRPIFCQIAILQSRVKNTLLEVCAVVRHIIPRDNCECTRKLALKIG